MSDLEQAAARATGMALRQRVEEVAAEIAKSTAVQVFETHAEAFRTQVMALAEVDARLTEALRETVAKVQGRIDAEAEIRARMLAEVERDCTGLRETVAKLDPTAAEEVWQQVAGQLERLSRERAEMVALRKAFTTEVAEIATIPQALRTEMQTLRADLDEMRDVLTRQTAEMTSRALEDGLHRMSKAADETLDAIRKKTDDLLGAVDPDAVLPRAFRGPHDPEVTYRKGDLVVSRGSTWIAVREGSETPVAKRDGQWQIFAAGGYGDRKERS